MVLPRLEVAHSLVMHLLSLDSDFYEQNTCILISIAIKNCKTRLTDKCVHLRLKNGQNMRTVGKKQKGDVRGLTGWPGWPELPWRRRNWWRRKKFTKVGRENRQQGEILSSQPRNGCWKAEMSKNIVQSTTHQSVDRLRRCIKHDGTTSDLTLNLAN